MFVPLLSMWETWVNVHALLPASAWPIPGHWAIWRVGPKMGDLSQSLPLYNSNSQINTCNEIVVVLM